MAHHDIQRLVGIRVRYLRDVCGMTQADLGGPLGMDPNYVGQIEAGRKNVTIKTLRKLTDGLGVDLPTFFDDSLFREMGPYASRFAARDTAPECPMLPATMRAVDRHVLATIMRKHDATIPFIAKAVGVSGPTVSRAIRRLKDAGYLCHVGPLRGGHWHVSWTESLDVPPAK